METIKFENIKEGDVVLVKASISYGWRSELSFWVSAKVERVTKAQIEVKGKKYWKKNGAIVGTDSFDRIYNVGDFEYSDRKIVDQTEEYNLALIKYTTIKKIYSKIEKLQKMSVPSLLELDSSLYVNILDALNKVVKEESNG